MPGGELIVVGYVMAILAIVVAIYFVQRKQTQSLTAAEAPAPHGIALIEIFFSAPDFGPDVRDDESIHAYLSVHLQVERQSGQPLQRLLLSKKKRYLLDAIMPGLWHFF
jgi:flagellar basal body-associated protein FliL